MAMGGMGCGYPSLGPEVDKEKRKKYLPIKEEDYRPQISR